MLTITDLTDAAIAELSEQMHDNDLAELRASDSDTNVAGMLQEARAAGAMAVAAYWNDRLFCAYGLTPNPIDGTGVPWMLSTHYLDDVPPVIVTRMGEAAVAEMRRHAGELRNWIHAEHPTAITFVRWLGFTVGDEPVGPGGKFREFTMKGEACAIQR